MPGDPIKVEGLTAFTRALKKMNGDLPKALRVAMNSAAQIVVDEARPHIPRRTGKAAASVKVRSTRTAVRISAGGSKAPYYPWLDFGGRTGRHGSVARRFYREGRFLYPSYRKRREDVQRALERALVSTAEAAGLEVNSDG